MAEEISVPPEVLETFLKIKRLVDATVDQLQTLPPLQLSASGTITSTGTASLTVVGAPAVHAKAHIPSPSVSATARPDVVQGKASIPAAVAGSFSGALPSLGAALAGQATEAGEVELLTVEEVNAAQVWIEAMKVAKVTIEIAGIPFAVWQIGEWILSIAK
ncbi:hypothetical protein ACGF0J_21895 [Nonomuraea sp. NPDC047897]|uniref:hypothetical protein n=1 Tax=Nonomuraea sp. NPDC047897 TaxID=3364346 RepID=UPI0037184B0E